jgi:hypothetical protein
METPMRRALLLTAIFSSFVAGLGCRHVGGRCDCTNNPADAVLPVPSNPFPVVGAPAPAPIVPGAPVPMPGK